MYNNYMWQIFIWDKCTTINSQLPENCRTIYSNLQTTHGIVDEITFEYDEYGFPVLMEFYGSPYDPCDKRNRLDIKAFDIIRFHYNDDAIFHGVVTHLPSPFDSRKGKYTVIATKKYLERIIFDGTKFYANLGTGLHTLPLYAPPTNQIFGFEYFPVHNQLSSINFDNVLFTYQKWNAVLEAIAAMLVDTTWSIDCYGQFRWIDKLQTFQDLVLAYGTECTVEDFDIDVEDKITKATLVVGSPNWTEGIVKALGRGSDVYPYTPKVESITHGVCGNEEVFISGDVSTLMYLPDEVSGYIDSSGLTVPENMRDRSLTTYSQMMPEGGYLNYSVITSLLRGDIFLGVEVIYSCIYPPRLEGDTPIELQDYSVYLVHGGIQYQNTFQWIHSHDTLVHKYIIFPRNLNDPNPLYGAGFMATFDPIKIDTLKIYLVRPLIVSRERAIRFIETYLLDKIPDAPAQITQYVWQNTNLGYHNPLKPTNIIVNGIIDVSDTVVSSKLSLSVKQGATMTYNTQDKPRSQDAHSLLRMTKHKIETASTALVRNQ